MRSRYPLTGRSRCERKKPPGSRTRPERTRSNCTDMTLRRFDGRALRIDQANRQVSKHVPVGIGPGFSVLPRMPGRQRRPLAADLAPGLVLRLPDPPSGCSPIAARTADVCSGSGPSPGTPCPSPDGAESIPSRTCDLTIPAGCGQDLTRGRNPPPSSRPSRARCTAADPGDNRLRSTPSFGSYAAAASAGDVRAIRSRAPSAARILADLPADDLPRFVPQDLVERTEPGPRQAASARAQVRPGFMSPARAASAAAAVTAAFRVFSQPDVQRPASSCGSWSKPYARSSGKSARPASTAGDAASVPSSRALISPL